MKRKKEAKKENQWYGLRPWFFLCGLRPSGYHNSKVWASPMGVYFLGFRRHEYQSRFN
jgi:hypothetical protein